MPNDLTYRDFHDLLELLGDRLAANKKYDAVNEATPPHHQDLADVTKKSLQSYFQKLTSKGLRHNSLTVTNRNHLVLGGSNKYLDYNYNHNYLDKTVLLTGETLKGALKGGWVRELFDGNEEKAMLDDPLFFYLFAQDKDDSQEEEDDDDESKSKLDNASKAKHNLTFSANNIVIVDAVPLNRPQFELLHHSNLVDAEYYKKQSELVKNKIDFENAKDGDKKETLVDEKESLKAELSRPSDEIKTKMAPYIAIKPGMQFQLHYAIRIPIKEQLDVIKMSMEEIEQTIDGRFKRYLDLFGIGGKRSTSHGRFKVIDSTDA